MIKNDKLNGKEDFVAYPYEYHHGIYQSNTELYEISSGCIHTFKNKQDAVDASLAFGKAYNIEYSVFECIIPSGTGYYEGIDSNGNDGYASEKIRFVKKIEKKFGI